MWATFNRSQQRTKEVQPRAVPSPRATERRSNVSAAVVIMALSLCVFWLVGIYGNALRDARYLDGWVLVAGMSLQIYFYAALKASRLTPKAATWWRRFHIRVGYVLIAIFLSHTGFALPDTKLEWALWSMYVLVALSGIFGAYLAWAAKTRHGLDAGINQTRYARRTEQLAREAYDLAATTRTPSQDSLLPEPPYSAWVLDLYATHVRPFFSGPRNTGAHLLSLKQHLAQILAEIDELSAYVDAEHREKLTKLRMLVIEKDQLDFSRVHLGVTRGWLFVHVPATYVLIVFTILHVIVAYAYTSEGW